MDKSDLILKAIDDLKKDINGVALRTQRLERTLKGDSEYEQKGLIHDIKDTKQTAKHAVELADSVQENLTVYINKEKIRRAKQTGLALGAGIGGGGFGAWLKSLFGG